MNLEQVTAVLRPRGPWEAADFGVRMIRRDAPAIYRAWFTITLPLLSLALLASVFSPYPTLTLLAYWWFEPLADGPILHIISQRLFGQKADARRALKATFSLALRNKIFLISPYRLHFARSTAMPLTQLEGLSGSARRARAKVLSQRIQNHGIGVTITYQNLALALNLGVVLVVFALIPTAYQDTLGGTWLDQFWQNDGPSGSVLKLLIFYVAQSALQPWFVGAGFGLYINRRTQLEAWDIEVAFRRMVQRRVSGLAAALVLAMLVIPLVSLPGEALAQDSGEIALEEEAPGDPGFPGFWEDAEVRLALDTVVASDALKTTRIVEEWQKIVKDEPEPEPDSKSIKGLMALMSGIGRFVSVVVEFGLWLLAGLLLGLLFATRKRWQPYLTRMPQATHQPRRVILASGEITAETLPADIPGEAMRLWRAGEKRRALSLFYRASVFAAVTRYGVRLPASATEGACIAAVTAQTDAAQAAFFRKIVTAWTRCAYAARAPDEDAMLLICREWPQHYGAQA